MHILVLKPEREGLEYAYFRPGQRGFVESARFALGAELDQAALASRLRRLAEQAAGAGLDAVGLRGVFGGAGFPEPTRIDAAALAELGRIAYRTPLHGPDLARIAAAVRQAFADIPAVLAFETSLFAALPERERYYGLDPVLADRLGLYRYGYHGLYHEAAGTSVLQRRRESMGPDPRRGSERILSICLEPRPEIAALMGRRPVTVTGGATPLEGLPGETSCGEIDPSIVLALSQKLNWGPEQIDVTLARQSGLLGLIGEPTHLGWLLAAEKAALTPAAAAACELIEYRILLGCGAVKAALGGVDHIVFSGRYAGAGAALGPWLAERLAARGGPRPAPVGWSMYHEPLLRIVADLTAGVAARASKPAPALPDLTANLAHGDCLASAL